ncbi:hypothetical protein BJ170DRAFT_702604 [Xylariales sp. AK1849]|nr:hypothetical protein BJ170DRAFT_702604 [Xylariales sp. AK1849]
MTGVTTPRPRPSIRIGNASGAIGDGIDQIYRLAKSGAVDAITADYLAEFDLAWKAVELSSTTEGALNPIGLATKVDQYFSSLDFNNVKIAAVTGDNVAERVCSQDFGDTQHLDRAGVLFDPSEGQILAANAYTGQAGFVRSLEEGADILICGRCCDASPVMGLAYWWHGWEVTDYGKIAACVTGGNSCGAQEIEHLHHAGYPIADIAEDGTAVITKPPNTNGAVTIDTCKAQLLYEIQGPRHLHPDVIGKDRVRLTGIKGTAPPPTVKLAICLAGGWQAELSGYCARLDTNFHIEKYESPVTDPRSQAYCTVQIRLFAQSPTKEAMTQFRRAIFSNGMQRYCGLHLSMDWRTMEPKLYIPLVVHFVDNDTMTIKVEGRKTSACTADETIIRPFGDLVFGRSGDKVGNANVGFWVRSTDAWPWLRAFMTRPIMTSSKMVHLLGNDWHERYTVERCEFANLQAVHFVVKGILQEGVSSSSILDGFGKSFGEFSRVRHVEIPVKLLKQEENLRREQGSPLLC